MTHMTFHLDDGRDVEIRMSATDHDLKGIGSSFAPLERVALQAALRRLADYLAAEGVLMIPAQYDTTPPIPWTYGTDDPKALCIGAVGCAALDHHNGCPA